MSFALFCVLFDIVAAVQVLVFLLTYVWRARRDSRWRFDYYVPLLAVIVIRCIADSAAWAVYGLYGPVLPLTYIDVAIFILGGLIYPLFLRMSVARIDHSYKRNHIRAVDVSLVVLAILLIVLAANNQLFFLVDGETLPSVGYLFVTACVGFVCLVSLVHLIVRAKISRNNAVPILAFVILLLIGGLLECVFTEYPLCSVSMLIAVQVLNATLYTDEISAGFEARVLAAERKSELDRSRNLLMVSQIQPHFLYNTLGAIAALCDDKPREAKNLTLHFSRYLRHNIKSLSQEDLVPFDDELRHVKEYLAIEKVRFGDRLKIEWDIQHQAFAIPTLTLQPLVENAIKYGIGPQFEGGTVTITTRLEEGFAVIVVEDDGVGFDVRDLSNPTIEGHFGLENISQRLKLTCGATLSHESVPGEGTRACIRIPQKGHE